MMTSGVSRKRFVVVLWLAVGAVAGFLLGSQFLSERMATAEERRVALKKLQAQYEAQQQQLINLEMADKVNKLTQEKLRERVAELQTERMNLENELFVYKKLAEDDEAEIGLNLESLTLRPQEGGDGRTFAYEILLRRKAGLDKSIEATLSLNVEGLLLGIPDTLSFEQVDPELRDESVSVTFKYFRVVKGQFVLPEHFEPRTIVLSLYETGRADSLIIKEFPWLLVAP